MRRSKLNAKAIEILATLSDDSDLDYGSDDSDADRTWHPQKVQIIGASDFSDSGEEDIEPKMYLLSLLQAKIKRFHHHRPYNNK